MPQKWQANQGQNDSAKVKIAIVTMVTICRRQTTGNIEAR